MPFKNQAITMKTKIIVLIFILTGTMACGPVKTDSLIRDVDQRVHDDSIKRAAGDDMKQKIEMKYAITDSISRISNEISSLNESIEAVKSECEVQKDKLAAIKEFKLFRSRDTRESQIMEKLKEINDLEKVSLELRNKLVNLQVHLDNFISESRKYSEN